MFSYKFGCITLFKKVKVLVIHFALQMAFLLKDSRQRNNGNIYTTLLEIPETIFKKCLVPSRICMQIMGVYIPSNFPNNSWGKLRKKMHNDKCNRFMPLRTYFEHELYVTK